MHISSQSPVSLLGESSRSHLDPDAGGVSGRSNGHQSGLSSTGASYTESNRWVNTVVGADSPEHSPNAVALRNKLNTIFGPHVTGQNRQDFDMLIEQRAIRLNEMGQTPEDVEATLAKGQMLDRLSQAVVGAVRSAPFGAASRLLDTVPELTSFAKTPDKVGFVAGLFSGAVDGYGGGGGVLKKATSDTQWLAAKPEQLETVMANAAKAREPSLARTTGEVGLAFQTYSLRNVLRTGTAAIGAEKMTKHAAAEMDSWISAVGSPVAGSAAYLALNRMAENNHRVGPEYLLGRQDWEAQYRALQEVNPLKDPLLNGGKRLLKVPVDIATDSLQSIRNLATATSVVQTVGMLGGGFAGVLSARDAAAKAAEKAGMGEVATAAISHAVNTVVSAPVYAAWTSAAVLTGPATDKAVGALQEGASSLFNRAADYLHGRPAGDQPRDDIALEMMEEGRLPPLNEVPPEPNVEQQVVQEEHQPPLNNAERNV